MKIVKEEVQGLTHHFSLVVAADALEKHVEQELQVVGKKAKMPGFRPGKVPMDVLRKRYSKDIMGDVLERAVNDATRELMNSRKLRPAMQPDVKITTYEEGKDLAFDISFDIMPEVPEIAFDKITVPNFTFDVPEEEITQGLQRLATSRRHTHSKEGNAALGDVVTIDFLGKIDGTPFSGGAAKGFQLELGSGQFIPGFEDQLVGVQKGDSKDVTVSFPENYHSKDLAGKPAVFEITVHEVSYFHVPEVTDKLAVELGFADVQALSNAVREQISADYQRAARSKAKKELFDALDNALKFEVPSKMVALEFDNVWAQVDQAKKAGDVELKDRSDDELKKEYTAIAERRVRLGIVLSEIGRKNNIQITREEISAAVMQQARMYPGQEDKVFEFFRKNPAQIDELKGPILEEKAVDFILEKVKRTEKKVSVTELFDEEVSQDDVKEKPKKASKKKADKAD